MAKRAAQQRTEPASLPEVPLPLSEVPEHQRSAYELEVINDPEMFRKILSNENFFEMIAAFPEAWWGDRLSMYLYRHESDDGMMVKNPQGEGNYIKPVIRQPVDRDWIANRNGGGKYQLWLNLSSPNPANPAKNISTTVRKYTFRIDGPPMVKEGQIIEIGGKPVSVGAAPAAHSSADDGAVSKVIDASARANESAMGILAHASETAIDMVKAQATRENAPQVSPVTQIVELAAALKALMPAPPVADPVQAELMKQIIARAFREPAETENQPQTPISETLATVRELKEVLPELLGRATKAAAADVTPVWIAPLIQIGQTFVQALPAIMAQSRATRDLEFKRMIFLRDAKPGQAIPQNLLAEPAPVQPAAQTVEAQPPSTPPGRNEVVQGIVARICNGFDRHRDSGADIAAAISVELGEHIEAFGLERALTDSDEMTRVVMEQPPLAQAIAQRSAHAKWKEFADSFNDYMQDRWGEGDDEGDDKEAGHGQEPPAA